MTLKQRFWRWWYRSPIYKVLEAEGKMREAIAFAKNPPPSAAHLSSALRFHMKLDSSVMLEQIGLEIVRRRQKLYDAGVRPDDPQIPDRWTIMEEWGEALPFENPERNRRLARLGYT